MEHETFISAEDATFSADAVEAAIFDAFTKAQECRIAALHYGDLDIAVQNEDVVDAHIENCDPCQQRENGRDGLN